MVKKNNKREEMKVTCARYNADKKKITTTKRKKHCCFEYICNHIFLFFITYRDTVYGHKNAQSSLII